VEKMPACNRRCYRSIDAGYRNDLLLTVMSGLGLNRIKHAVG
jgi:hypothetical protein